MPTRFTALVAALEHDRSRGDRDVRCARGVHDAGPTLLTTGASDQPRLVARDGELLLV